MQAVNFGLCLQSLAECMYDMRWLGGNCTCTVVYVLCCVCTCVTATYLLTKFSLVALVTLYNALKGELRPACLFLFATLLCREDKDVPPGNETWRPRPTIRYR